MKLVRVEMIFLIIAPDHSHPNIQCCYTVRCVDCNSYSWNIFVIINWCVNTKLKWSKYNNFQYIFHRKFSSWLSNNNNINKGNKNYNNNHNHHYIIIVIIIIIIMAELFLMSCLVNWGAAAHERSVRWGYKTWILPVKSINRSEIRLQPS